MIQDNDSLHEIAGHNLDFAIDVEGPSDPASFSASTQKDEFLGGASDNSEEKVQIVEAEGAKLAKLVAQRTGVRMEQFDTPEKAKAVIDTASDYLAHSSLGIEGARDVLALISASLAGQNLAVTRDELATRIRVGYKSPVDANASLSVFNNAGDYLSRGALGPRGTRDILVLVQAALANKDAALKYMSAKSATRLTPDTEPSYVRSVVSEVSERLARTSLGNNGARDLMALVNSSMVGAEPQPPKPPITTAPNA